ncbi:MAG: hypothetical protein QF815_03380 [Candidatus Peribacteraceae bacterium]|jgi:hypothetical protein|nr:hypothetical protein [Candidatus Peribacteraceae bacterium]MDP7476831.1 hypothetical protein [Candidatus Peribacteraceae bacterium]
MKRFLLEVVVIAFLTGTVVGFCVTLFRYSIPYYPIVLRNYHYGMMAPFQGYDRMNIELIAEGKSENGQWERIDIDQYLPYGRGEKSMRAGLTSFRFKGKEALADAYRRIALRMQQLEQDRDRTWSSVRLATEKWPMSKDGYEALRNESNITRIDLVQIP